MLRIKKTENKKAFTLLELLVVISIIGFLTTIILVSLSTFRANARDTKRLSDVEQLKIALSLYFNTNGAYPHMPCVDNRATYYLDYAIPCWNTLNTLLAPFYKLQKDPLHSNFVYGGSLNGSLGYTYVSKDNGRSYQIWVDMERMDNNPTCPGVSPNFYCFEGN